MLIRSQFGGVFPEHSVCNTNSIILDDSQIVGLLLFTDAWGSNHLKQVGLSPGGRVGLVVAVLWAMSLTFLRTFSVMLWMVVIWKWDMRFWFL